VLVEPETDGPDTKLERLVESCVETILEGVGDMHDQEGKVASPIQELYRFSDFCRV
jgi:hypothetical protein